MSMAPDVPTSSSLSSHHPLRIATWVVGLLALAGAITVAVLPLPKPAAGGTCGPGRGSETAIQAFFDPISIGAGAKPTPSQFSDALHYDLGLSQWQAFVGECQASTNARMVDALALLVVAGFFLLFASPLVGRTWRRQRRASAQTAAAGWYPDPSGSDSWRWWDGRQWSHETRAGEAPGGPAAAPPLADAPKAGPSDST